MKAIILAAGRGTRMRSNTQKVMHPILGKPLLQYVTQACQEAGIADITLVVPTDSDDIRSTLPGLNYVTQPQQLGTGHATQGAALQVSYDDDVLILAGDMPLVTPDFVRELISFYKANGETCVVAGDHMPSDTNTKWANASIYMFKGNLLIHGLTKLTNNSQGEYCLTQVPNILHEAGHMIYAYKSKLDASTFTDINTQAQLAEATKHMRERINMRHMENGVRIHDPATTYIDDTVDIAQDVIIYPGCILEGACVIQEGAIIGPYTHMRDTVVGKATTIRQSVLNGAKIGQNTEVGPFAYLRPNAVIGNKCRIGNFVEVKNANLDDGVKMAHLSYIGDADVGRDVNYGCGAITANYDGKKKHRTTIADGAFIGCNANLVAPVEIGERALVTAGSTITEAVPAECMSFGRARQVNKEGRAKR
ncbi:MAG: NTP transferase domain-containing protein [Defluviitaleaceae bacterium]|nr:NTP transferase domain-containing protein [Defluviitaleaceae bacterium]